MFAKLFKHEFLATWRVLATVAGVIILVCGSPLALSLLQVEVLTIFAVVIAVIGFAGLGAVAPIILAFHYWRTMYGGAGYLTHTLPVRGRVIFAAKAVYACLASLIGGILAIVLVLSVAGSVDRLSGEAAGAPTWQTFEQFLRTGQLWVLVVIMPVYLICLYLIYLSGITLGTRGHLGRLGAGGAVIGLVAANVVTQVVTAATMVVIPFGLRLAEPRAGTFVTEAMWPSLFADGSGPPVLGMGWIPAVMLLAVVLVVLAVRGIERHTCLR